MKSGDRILGYNFREKRVQFSSFVTWLHYGTGSCQFKRVKCTDRTEVYASSEHLVMTGEDLETELVRNLEVGMSLFSDAGASLSVAETEEVTLFGYAAPLTRNGNLFVDGVLFSCYAHMDPKKSRFLGMKVSPQLLGNIRMRPLIIRHSLFSGGENYEADSEEYMNPYAKFMFRVYKKMSAKHIICK